MLSGRPGVHRELSVLAIFVVVFITVFNQSAAAERRLALVIGINRYDNLPLDRNLKKAAGDAREMSSLLTKLGFEVDTGIDVDRHEFNRLWAQFLSQLSPDDSAVFHFSGHGVELSGVNYLVVRDVPNVSTAGETLLRDESIGLNKLLDDIRRKRLRLSLLIVDACRNNPFGDSRGRSIGGARGLAGIEPPKGTFIMYSAGIGQTALDRLSEADANPSSVYMRSVLPLLSTPGLSLTDIAKKVRGRVRALALAAGEDQTPAYYDELIGDFYPAGEAGNGAPKGYDKFADAKEIWFALKDSANSVQLRRFAEDYAGTPFARYALLRQVELKKHAEETAAECDRLAASPFNDDGKNGGIDAEKIDTVRAVPACRAALAANPGSPRLMYELGRALGGKDHAELKDAIEARSWFEIAANKGYPLAMANLGTMYYDGRGGSQDYAKARLWLERGAETGEMHCMTSAGIMYSEGRAVPRDYVKARQWFEKSAAKGDTHAMNNLGIIYSEGRGVPRNYAIAKSWFEKAATKGEGIAMYNIGTLYEEGKGVRRDPVKAKAWFEKAKGFGYVPAEQTAIITEERN